VVGFFAVIKNCYKLFELVSVLVVVVINVAAVVNK
jgi:hypothetical protein